MSYEPRSRPYEDGQFLRYDQPNINGTIQAHYEVLETSRQPALDDIPLPKSELLETKRSHSELHPLTVADAEARLLRTISKLASREAVRQLAVSHCSQIEPVGLRRSSEKMSAWSGNSGTDEGPTADDYGELKE